MVDLLLLKAAAKRWRPARRGVVMVRVRMNGATVAEKLEARRFIAENGCWEWPGASSWGYGAVWDSTKQKTVKCHRAAYEIFVGPIPPDKEINHLCKNRICFNPKHLETVSHLTNVRRGNAGKHVAPRAAQQTHCKHGHERSHKNTYVQPNNGKKSCLICRGAVSKLRWNKAKRRK